MREGGEGHYWLHEWYRVKCKGVLPSPKGNKSSLMFVGVELITTSKPLLFIAVHSRAPVSESTFKNGTCTVVWTTVLTPTLKRYSTKEMTCIK